VATAGEAFVVEASALDRVRDAATPKQRRLRGTIDEFPEVLSRESSSQISYPWAGYVLATLLSYLDERGIRLMESEHDDASHHLSNARGGTIFVLTPRHRDEYLQQLDPARFDAAELRRYYEEFTGTDAEGVEEPMLGGVSFLRDTLGALRESTVAVLVVA
jgi:hypothetical protein